jgi:hypothetical protein
MIQDSLTDRKELFVGKKFKLATERNKSAIDSIEVTDIAFGMIRCRFIERARTPIIWIPISSISELRETEG